jgi:hypothetical protein
LGKLYLAKFIKFYINQEIRGFRGGIRLFGYHRRRHGLMGCGCVLAVAVAGAAAYAVYKFVMCNEEDDQCNKLEDEEIKVMKSAYDSLRNKIGVSDTELQEARLAGMSAYDLAKDKGFSEEQLKMFINHDRFIAIDELVLNRKISREIGEHVKEKIKEHTENWNGRLC